MVNWGHASQPCPSSWCVPLLRLDSLWSRSGSLTCISHTVYTVPVCAVL
ncbi:hypothetical protein G647_06271 [Cladophialophora carrionii CBS 160.54]|uniref:Uncharacterized protein n=1 Tax=Cladophialophora carrionii CBS 160.54 TaxID=1279043 RepID=V9D7C4_9EURO|nr:uncharacterized protein G647_06271 [Cladophialophora carrionii CBS 160.54]ETI22198.1 hypothetical protein G647_06271 [Cladophialophora carrionii CBS 160.54]